MSKSQQKRPAKPTDTELLDWLEEVNARITRPWGLGLWRVASYSGPYNEGEGKSLRTAIRRAAESKAKEKGK